MRTRIRRIVRLVSRDRPGPPYFKATAVPVWRSVQADEEGSEFPETDGYGQRFADPELPCHGCAHSASGAPFPGHPSGERPCLFCERNPNGIDPSVLHPNPSIKPRDESSRVWLEKLAKIPVEQGVWYNGTPSFKTPMDCYIATDMLQQHRIWDVLEDYERKGKPFPPREKFPALHDPDDEDGAWCCEGGDGPGGHTWTCWAWLGFAYG